MARVVPTFSLESLSRETEPAEDTREHRFLGPDGTERWVLLEISRVQRTRRVVAGVCLRIRDRTALRAAEMESESHIAMLEALDMATGEGILVKSDSGETRYVNDAFASLWRMTPQEMVESGYSLQKQLATQLSETPPKSIQRLWHRDEESFDSSGHEIFDLRTRDGRTLEVDSLEKLAMVNFRCHCAVEMCYG